MAHGRIFINYRREDSRADSGRLYDHFKEQFPGRVFQDVGSLEPGVEWPVAIAEMLNQTSACIVVIGKSWLDIRDQAGKRRLDNPDDPVRQEIVTALQHKTPIFPVLVGRAEMPKEEDLPEDLRPLCRLEAYEFTEQVWEACYQRLLKSVKNALHQGSVTVLEGSGARNKAIWIAVAALCLCAVAAIGVYQSRKHVQVGSTPAAVPAQPLTPHESSDLVGTWHAVVTTSAGGYENDLELYSDHSFRILFRGMSTALGNWQYDAGPGSLDLVRGINFTENGAKFSCTFHAGGTAEFAGSCQSGSQTAASASLKRLGAGEPPVPGEVPVVDVSALTLAERAAFGQLLATQHCPCGCGMTIMTCLQKASACPNRSKMTGMCPRSSTLAKSLLKNFLALTRA